MKISHLIIPILLLTTQLGSALTFKGYIRDGLNREPLVGAIVIDKENNKIHEIAGLDGSFTIKNLNEGVYHLEVRYMGYKTLNKKIVFTTGDHEKNIDFLLEADEISLNQAIVEGHVNKESNAYALKREKNATELMNVTSAKDIQLSPDITVANVLQRVSGVSVQKTSNSGEGQYAIIRGMDKRYNYTLVNGVKIPSPDNKNRYVPMDIFPADLMSSIEVIKSLTPEMEGDAIGGVMNLVFKDAPNKFMLHANFALGYNQMFLDRPFYKFDANVINRKSPAEMYGPDYHAQASDFPTANLKYDAIKPLPNFNGGFSIGNRFFDKRLGVILAVSNQSNYTGSDTFFASPKAQPNENNEPAFETSQLRTYSTYQNRLGIHNKFDYVLDKNNKISLYNLYLMLNKEIARHTVETSLATGVGNIMTKDRSLLQLERIYNSTLQGKHKLADGVLNLDWSAVYSRAWANVPDDAQLQYNSTQVDNQILQGITHKWRNNSDQDISGYLNLAWHPTLFDQKIEIKGGGMYRHKTRHNYYNEYTLQPVLVNNAPQTFTDVDHAQFAFAGYNADLGSPVNQNDYDVTENVGAYYGEVKFKLFDKLQVLAGARVEHTKLNYTTPMPDSFEGRYGHQIYTDILPSIHLRYALKENQNLRFSYFSSISRPGYFEVIPYQISGDYFDEKGNPYLKRSKANNFDLRYEWFHGSTDQILLGTFYKRITDPIEYGFVRENGPSSLQLKPQNFGTASNYGFEFVIVKYFNSFGVSANYTYTKSKITTEKGSYERDPVAGLVTKTVSETRPMQGQAENIANFSLLYKNQKNGLDAQLSAVYTGKYISQVSGYVGLDYWSMPMTTLDFSVQQRLSKKINLVLFAKARNLLNSSAITRIMHDNAYYSGNNELPDQDSQSSIVVQNERYKQSYLLGLRYSF